MKYVALISLLTLFVFCVRASDNPVYRFIENQDIDSIELYLEYHDINAVLEYKNTTLLVYAITKERPRVCRLLIEKDADVNQYVQGVSPLMHASRESTVRIVKQLIKASAAITALDSLSNNALFYAAAGGNVKICKALLKNGAPLNDRNQLWQTAYDYSVINRNTDVAIYLRQYYDNNPPDMRDGPFVKWGLFHRVKAMYIVHDSTKRTTRKYNKTFKAHTDPYLMKGFSGDSLEYLLYKSQNIQGDNFSGIEKILVVGDIHGGYDSLLKFLINNEVINRDLQWTWGKGHVVFLGDIFDRGDRVTEVLWLIYSIENQALRAGGNVHLLLGNHEIMVLSKNKQYISHKYRLLTERMNIEYYMLFSKRTLLGRWLRTKNTIIKLNGHLFVHAGLSPSISFSGLGIHEINELTRYFLNHPERDHFKQVERNLILGANGPFWYRGFLENNHQYGHLSEREFEKVLDVFDASKIFIGHTNVDHITPFYNSRVYSLDVPFYTPGFSMEALLLEGNSIYLLNSDGNMKKILE